MNENVKMVDWSGNHWQFQEGGGAYDDVPPAAYLAEFKGVTDKTVNPVPGQPPETKWRFEFRISSGPHAGKTPPCLVGRKIGPNTHAGRLIAGFKGSPLAVGDNLPNIVQEAVGKTWLVNVAPGPQGGKPAVRFVSAPPQM